MARSVEQFQTIHAEGAILPPDVLQRIATGELEGLDPTTYHLPSGTKTKEAISQSWTRLLRYWKDFQAARKLILDSDETGTLATREKWLLPLFQELGYGRLTTTKAPEIDGKLFPIERFWQHIPIHLIGCKLDLDHRTKGARGAATAIPHSMVQEFLNRSAEHAWAFLSNGLQLRVLRDSAALSRQSYVEFDLEAMMDGEVYADFAVMWLVCHQSRLEGDKPEDLWLEKWSRLAQEQGTRILEDLRIGVQKAIEALGRGFVSHPRNETLIARLQSGALSTQDYYRQILRIVYRFLFLFVAEDRGLLHPPAPVDEKTRPSYDEACQRYDRFYSLRRLRDLAESYRGSKHADLWHSLSLLFDSLGQSEGCPQLALPAFGSFLWSRNAAPDLSGPAQSGVSPSHAPALIRNEDLLDAVRALAFVERNRVFRAVNYRNLGSIELGSVYESLLELHPQINIAGRSFALNIAAGNERKTSGSFYTPDSLVQCLLDSALEPVVAVAIRGKSGAEAAKAILNLKVCDPAVGSGHFLLAAAHRLARHLARARTGESEPSPQDYQHALRDVIGHCVFGVDLNPMAVELCKISLWMEALEPGKPLSFLDHRIVVGNSLLGSTPTLLFHGIPEAAFEPIEGDDKSYCRSFKKQNKDERKGQGMLFAHRQPWEQLGNLATSLTQLDSLPDDSVVDIRTKEQRYADLVKSSAYESGRLLADTWCAAFVWKKTKEFDYPITERIFRDIEHNPHSILPWMKNEIVRLRDHQQFFHWHLAFPDVFVPIPKPDEADTTGWIGGFDIVLGNPPWERMKLQEKEWFAERIPEITSARNATERKRMIEKLLTDDPELHGRYLADCRKADSESVFARKSRRFPLTGSGDVNTYALFAETALAIVAPHGRVGFVVPSGIATDESTSQFFSNMVTSKRLVSVFDFENRERLLFPNVYYRMRFALLTAAGIHGVTQPADFLFLAYNVNDLNDSSRHFSLTGEEFCLLSPDSKTCPMFLSSKDASICISIYKLVPTLGRVSTTDLAWDVKYKRMFDMGTDSDKFVTPEFLQDKAASKNGNRYSLGGCQYLPLYEGRMISVYHHRVASVGTDDENTFRSGVRLDADLEETANPNWVPQPRYWISESEFNRAMQGTPHSKWFLSIKDITSATNMRTVIACVLPQVAAGHTCPIFVTGERAATVALFLANLNAFVLDYAARKRVSGNHLTLSVLNQLPILRQNAYEMFGKPVGWSVQQWISDRVLELSFTAWDLRAFAADCGYTGPPFVWNDDRRFQIRCELDALFFHLYGVTRDDADFIMDTFPIVKRKDEEQYNNDYRTKRVILEIYDAMEEALRSGQAYKTLLDPPPADPRAAHQIGHEDQSVIGTERVWLVILLLIRAWKQKGLAVGRPALETGLLLMFNDELRKNLLGIPAISKASIATTPSASSLVGLDFFIAEGAKRNWLRVTQSEYQQTIEAGELFPASLDVPVDDLTRAAESMTVIDRLAKREIELPAKVKRVELSTKSVSTAATAGAR